MPEGTSNSLINLGDISKPAEMLIEKISKAVGGLFAPYQMKRIAKAEAEAALIKAESGIQITDLHRRALHRFVEEEANRQKNMEDITAKAIPMLKENSDASSIQDDWLANFFDKARLVSDVEMQKLWSRILAGEANAPGTYSKRTVNFLTDLDRSDAQLFSKLCGFAWIFGDAMPLVFDLREKIYNREGIDFGSLTHLESIGLIKFDGLTGFVKTNLGGQFVAIYYGKPLVRKITAMDSLNNKVDIGHCIFTKIARELFPICGSRPVEGFFDYVTAHWEARLAKPEAETDIPASPPALPQ